VALYPAKTILQDGGKLVE